MGRKRGAFGMAGGIFVLALFSTSIAVAEANPELRACLQTWSQPGGCEEQVPALAAAPFLQEFYAFRGYRLVWDNPDSVAAFRSAVDAVWRDGLSPEDYLPQESIGAVAADLVLTDALVRLMHHLRAGKVKQGDSSVATSGLRPLAEEGASKTLSDALDAGDIEKLLVMVRPQTTGYHALTAALETYTALAENGGWLGVPEGSALKPGMRDPRIVMIRRNLAERPGSALRSGAASDLFDGQLEAAVRRFQGLHGLGVDGVVGARTLAAMNVSAQERVQQIRVNLERLRWSAGKEDGHHLDRVVVNSAAFKLRLFLDDTDVWATDVIAGCEEHPTPVFSAMMRRIIFNPEWVVPRSIVRRSIFPKAKSDPSFLSRGGYDLFSAAGEKVDPRSIDWTNLTAWSFPYTVVQQPGPKNALGRVKFVFPNSYDVYLHDTPSRHLFDKAARAFSAGCIRVKDPLTLAQLILADRKGWTRQQVELAVESEARQRVELNEPLAVLVRYETVEATAHGDVHFFDDVYGRDQQVLEALNTRPWQVSFPATANPL